MVGWEKKELGRFGRSWRNIERPARLAVVFVHGFQGDDLETWTYTSKSWFGFGSKKERVELFDLLTTDKALEEALPCDYYSLSHRGSMASPADISDTAHGLKTFIKTYVAKDLPVVLIAHSFGGLVCRQAILYMLENGEEDFRIAGLMMFGTPNNGTEMARAAKLLGSSGAATDMAPFNKALAELNRDWAARVTNGGDPDAPPGHRASLLCRFVVGDQDKIVPRASAGTLASFADLEYLPYGHIEMVKPRNRDDPSYRLISSFLLEAEQASVRRTGESVVSHLTHRLRQATLNGRWVREEEEHIHLDTTDDPNWLSCEVCNIRRGGLAQRRFHICIFLTDQRPGDQKIDFNWELRRGNLTEQEFVDLSSLLRDDPTKLFRVDTLTVHQGGAEVKYVAREPLAQRGWVIFRFEASQPIAEERPYDDLTLKFTTRVDRRQGWYHYGVGRTVAERLKVTFVAPFQAPHINTLMRGADFRPPTFDGKHYIHKVTVDKPLPLGRGVIWIYPRR